MPHRPQKSSHLATLKGSSCGTPVIQAVAGALGGTISLLITYPLCLLSTRSQFSIKTKLTSRNRDTIPCSLVQWKFNRLHRLADILQRVFRQLVSIWECLRTWYAGVGSAVSAQLIIQYVYYYAYTIARRLFFEFSPKLLHSVFVDVATASFAGICGATVSQPLWVINTKKSVDLSQQSSLSLLIEIAQKKGILALFDGLLPSYFLVLNPVIAYSIFEGLKKLHSRESSYNENAVLSAKDTFVYSAIGKIVATLVSYPYIVARNLMQYGNLEANHDKRSAERLPKSAINQTEEKISILGAWKHILSNKGLRGLYRGLESKLFQSVLNHSLLFVLQSKISIALTNMFVG
uniref:Uncharacterized protein n=1 Tax=Paramoeba aestuarina TaxID=180227 RepID=A0A7S4KRP3_9EUKA|mmetsp:Transcript_2359/g.3667  ORF Transcript_2359/g.3667 Transcript_2359/m.3667 type:complete len:348 (+) Transcript_2359:37-1080(+)